MNCPEFTALLSEAVQLIVSEDINVEIYTTEKLNQCTKYGLIFKKKEFHYAPIIYMDPFYAAFLEGHTVEALAEEVYRCYLEEKYPFKEEVNDFLDFETAKNYIFVKLINIQKNQQLLKDVPYRKFLDLAVIPYYEVNSETIYKGSITIRYEHLKSWNIDEEKLMNWAIEHTRLCKGMLFSPISDMISGFLDEELFPAYAEGLYVLTNDEKYLGAVQISFPGIIEQISRKLGGDLFMIPSSIHEWIVLAADDLHMAERLWEIVQEVNDNEVKEEEFLSDNVYFYSVKRQKVFSYNERNKKITGLFK